MALPNLPEGAIVYRLLRTDAVVALIGQKLWPDLTTQDPPLPFVVYQRQRGDRLVTLGSSKRLAGYDVSLDCVARTAAEQQAIAAAVTDALDGWVDNTIGVKGVFISPAESQDFVLSGGVYRSMSLNARIWFRPLS